MEYQDAKIYKLFAIGIEDVCYIGSTTTSLSKRLCSHISAAKTPGANTQCRSNKLFEEGNEVIIILLEECPCSTKEELHARERYWIGRFPDAINHNIPGRDWKERWEANKDRNALLHRNWIEANKESEAAKKAAKRLADLEGARAKDKEQRERNKEKIAAAKKVKVVCDVCKKEMNKGSLWEHKKIHTP